jgi:hypothetical protein
MLSLVRTRLVAARRVAPIVATRAYTAPPDEPKFLQCFEQFFQKAAGLAKLSPDVIEGLKSCQV